MSNACACGADAADAFICRACMNEFARLVDDLLGRDRPGRPSMRLLHELNITATRQDKLDGQGPALYSARGDIGPEPVETLPPSLRTHTGKIALPQTPWQFAWDAANLLDDARHTLVTLGKHMERNVGKPMSLPLETWFGGYLHTLATDPDGPEWLDAVRWLHGAALRAIDRVDTKRYAGKCNAMVPIGFDADDTLVHAQCTRDLYYRDGAPNVKCRDCATVHDIEERKAELLATVDDRIESATTIANALTGLLQPVTASMIRQMAYARQIECHGVAVIDGRRHTLYRVGDVVAVLAHRAEKQARRELA